MEYTTTINLKKFSELKLFKFLINNTDLWKKEKAAFKKLAWVLANPKQRINAYKEGLEISTPDDNQLEFVSIVNLASKFIRYNIDKLHSDLGTIIKSIFEVESTYNETDNDNIFKFLNFAIAKLNKKEKKLLKIFYILSINEPKFIISEEALVKLAKNEKLVTKLEDMGFIEKDDEGMFRAVYRGSKIKLELFGGEVEQDKRNNSLEIAIRITTKNFFMKGKEHKSENLVKEIIQKSTGYNFDDSSKAKSNPDQLYSEWSRNNKSLYCKLLNRFAKYYKDSSAEIAKLCYKEALDLQIKLYGEESNEFKKTQECIRSLELLGVSQDTDMELEERQGSKRSREEAQEQVGTTSSSFNAPRPPAQRRRTNDELADKTNTEEEKDRNSGSSRGF
ncbi:hypothetical protein NF27_DP01050 [Candidatus Jidaibacter acanthamoeba]|uniref:Uncharacterized protein n=1 Tax=Candidatus Jidaibacter acanthamoebae TaxID=86105 RepID=A0A0C1MZR6_9RICK|nr:hypothetical protein [Candidatus Jidaibacter acanthamoeba]KIE05561.1 hypothetical protein NF27_DP01050 [Candidatus Jidaibacter acanthamoeba]